MHIAYSRDFQYKRIADRKQLFFDDDVIACVRNIKRTLHTPSKCPENPLIFRDKEWEVVPYFRTPTFNVVYDDKDSIFKCWYEDYYDYFGRSKVNILQGNRVYFAQSHDGIHWEKPVFDKFKFNGKETNTVFSYAPYEMASCNSILLDPNEIDPAKRFKTVYVLRFPNANNPKKSAMRTAHAFGLHAAFSSNGLDWVPYDDNPLLEDWGCDVEILTYDPIDKKYLLFGRSDNKWSSPHPSMNNWFIPVWPGNINGIWGTRRCIYRLESEDFFHWSDPQLIFEPGAQDNLDDAHYGFVPWRADEMHLGFLNILHEVDNTVDMELLFSRDGINWNRFPGQRPIIPRGSEGSYDCLDIETPTQPLIIGDKIWTYYGGGSVHHDWWLFGKEEGLAIPEARDPQYARNGYKLCLATLRLNGWVSLDASIREGYIETKPVFSRGAHLFINTCCRNGGSVEVEVTDNYDNVWPAHSRDHCARFDGDNVHHKVCWSSTDKVNAIPGITKFRFYLKNAELYSFQISDK